MIRRRRLRGWWLAPAAVGAAWLYAPAAEPPLAEPTPAAAPVQDDQVRPVQDQSVVPQEQPPSLQAPPTTTGQGAASALGLGQDQAQASSAGLGGLGAANLGTATAPRAEVNSVAGTATSVPLAGGQASPVLNAPDLGEILSKSPAAAGVEVQRRNAIISDPRVRGQRVGQVVTLGDGALFFPSRQDLDTAIAKFDPGSVRDVVIVKGPYSALYGPGFSFLDIVTLDSPRYECDFEAHGRTSFGHQTNGARWDGLQSVFGGGADWGFRATYNILSGNDYRAGDGTRVPASYNSQNVNFALGYDLTPNSKIEFKGLRVHQHDLEFPGLYFDIRQLDTEAYSLRYTLTDMPSFDRLTFDVWYNTTVADGDTLEGAKQAFVQRLLDVSFNAAGVPFGERLLFSDLSTTRFSNKSLGYRLALGWGKERNGPTLTAGTDLNILGQTLIENIRIQQLAGAPLNGTAVPPGPGGFPLFTQDQSIPNSSLTDPGVFVESSVPVNERLKLKTGGRLDWVQTSSDPRLITGNVDLFGATPAPGLQVERFNLDPIVYSSDPGSTDLDRDFFLLAGFVTGEYKLSEKLTGLAAVGYAERAPTLTELYAAGPFVGVLQQGTSRLIGDPNLEKERLTQFDVGLKADYGWFRGGVTGFYAFIDDYITFDQNKGGVGLTQVVFTNTDRATLAGGEMFFQTDLTSWLTPFGSASYVQGIDRTHRDRRRPPALASSRRDDLVTGERATASEALPQMPPLEIRSGFRLHAPSVAPKWQVEFSARSVFGQHNVASSLGEVPTAGFTVFDVRSYWQVTKVWLLTAGVENFGDKLYREHLDPISGNLLGVGPLFRAGTNYYFASQFTY